MKLVSRALTIWDFDHCWRLIVGGRQLGPSGKEELRTAWRDLLASGVMQGAVIYDIDSHPTQLLAFGASVFVKRAWLQQFLSDPEPYASLAILIAHSRKDSPILRAREVARANHNEGLDLFVVHQGWRTDFPVEALHDTCHALIENFQRVHRGFNIEHMAGEVYGQLSRDFCIRGSNWTECSDFSDYFRHASLTLPPANEHPFLMKASRSVAVSGTALWSMFRFSPPVLRLSPRQRAVMKLVVDGTPRPEIAVRLVMSNESVRSCFRAALAKAIQHETVGKLFRSPKGELLDRGKQIQTLIAFLDEHFEELRPWPRRSSETCKP